MVDIAMSAFDKIQSGIPGLDEALDHVRLGDNVVWQISDLEEFRAFAEPFARQAVADGRNVIYIRFAQHEPVLRDLRGIQLRRFNPDEGFEPFTVAIQEEITRQGRDAFYVFDCLSELQSVWYTDLMMDVVVQIDPVLYYNYPYNQKYGVAKAIEAINDFYRRSGKNLLLMTPGRVGTSSPELGVPVTFRAISNFSAVCEVSDSRAGFMPELSYGSHMFQDLVEARILYGAIYDDKRTHV